MTVCAGTVNKLLPDRLDSLSRVDPISAEQIREALSGTEQSDCLPEPVCNQEEKILYWLRQQDEPPEVVLMIGADPLAVDAFLDHLVEKARIFILEKDVNRIVYLFKNRPVEEWVSAGRVVLALGLDADVMERKILRELTPAKLPRMGIYDTTEGSERPDVFCNKVLHNVYDSLLINVTNLGTLVHLGLLWQFNLLKNMPLIMTNPGVNKLGGMFKGRPAIIAGAGPSLNAALPFIRELRSKFVLISTCTALRPLRNAGLIPDLAVSVDGSEKTAPQFETKCDDLYLACTTVSYPPSLKKFKGLFPGYISSNPIDGWLKSIGVDKGNVAAAGTVTTSAIDLAVQMGCNPVITVGVDLSFGNDGTTHAVGSMYDGKKADTASLIKVPGNYSDSVLTNRQFKCYIVMLEEYIKSHPGTDFVNATNGGARFEGMRLIRPEGVVDLAKEEIKAYDMISRAHEAGVTGPTEEIMTAFNDSICQLDRVLLRTRKGAMICNQLMALLRRPRQEDEKVAAKMLATLKAVDNCIEKQRHSSAILDMSLRPVTCRLNAQERQEYEAKYSEAVLALRRTRDLYEQVAGAARWTRTLVDEAVNEIQAAGAGDEPSAMAS